MLEFGFKNIIDFVIYGLVRNFWNFECIFGGLSGGVVVVVLVGIVFLVGVSDGGGFIRIFVLFCGLIGLKFLWGMMLVGLYVWWGW